jgi:RNA polymerase sigma-70 factor, ECF subfamily
VTCQFVIPLSSTSPIAPKSPARSIPLGVERDEMLRSIPILRRFAKSLTGDPDRAEDLVQDALVRGIANIRTFRPGTNIQAWLMTILRNSFLSQLRMHRREIAYKASLHAEPIASHPNQFGAVQIRELGEALTKVPNDQRKALLLVYAYGHSYAQAAVMCHCPVGTIKSRANRARERLAQLMGAGAADFGPDQHVLGLVAAAADYPAKSERIN